MQRVAVVGPGGAGKSTFSDELGRRTGLPVMHLDRYHWLPGWVAIPKAQWHRTLTDLASAEQWILDGNYAGTAAALDVRFSRADTVIILGLPPWRCLVGVLRRWWTNRGIALQAEGCPERVDLRFLRWVWRYPVDTRPRIDAAIARHADRLRVIELSSPAAMRSFLTTLGPIGNDAVTRGSPGDH